MHRRDLMLRGAGLLATAALGLPTLAGATSPARRPGLRETARRAWLYGLPLIEVAAVRRRILGATPANVLFHQRDLLTVATQRVTSPNNDTLYSRAVLDLSRGPVELTLPPSGDRYLSVALMDMFTNNFAVLGTRTTGSEGGRFVIAGPTGAAPAGAIRSPGPWVFLLARTLADGVDDLPEARRVQAGLAVAAPAGPAPTPVAPAARSAPWREYFASVGALLAETPPPATDLAFFNEARVIGLTPGGFNPPAFSAAEDAEIAAGVAEAALFAAQPRGGTYEAGGWAYPRANLGDFGEDYEFRAQIALTGLFALPVAEAIYTRSTGDDATGLYRGDRYRLSFPKGQLLPVDGFWSLTAYKAFPEGQFLFAPNPINRYSIGDRTPGLVYNPDGSLDLWITREDPGGARSANWLPAPDGAFILSLRAYLPRPAMITGEYRAPPPVRL
ncbi:DUF1254 domain-containing protein [Caulobacter sp. NIBR1757]|uniref:DUF1254 domain-containing protein n=1 Tax=Caulobacter sp. NIBR1757 TaxID=3016000 RepID=UPI0022EFEDA0|nr:DUF1254 domain-containing protein [Caulobacter sp. NIBR1757]